MPQPKGSPGSFPSFPALRSSAGAGPPTRPLALPRMQAVLLASALGHVSKRQLIGPGGRVIFVASA